MTDQFVNPYTFVPLPSVPPERGMPSGHSGHHPELLSGKLSLRIRALTPLLIRGFGERDAEDQPANTVPRRPDGTAFIPGSSLKGAIRSLHETLTGSCLRVFDEDHVPSYRDVAELRKLRRPAVVSSPPKDGEPPRIKLCEPAKGKEYSRFRLHQDILVEHGGELRSGQRLKVSWPKEGPPSRVAPDAAGEWVLFLSDAGARVPAKPYHAHIRKLPENFAERPEVEVPRDVWDTFLRVVEDTDDRRTSKRSDNAGKTVAPVVHEYEPEDGTPRKVHVGYRHLAGPDLEQGQPV